MSSTRFPVLPIDTLDDHQRVVYDEITAGPRGSVRGPFIPLLHNPALAQRVQALGEHLRFGTNLPDELLEMAILLTARHWNCTYEWYAHEKLARRAGLADAIIVSISQGRRPAELSATAACVYDFCVQTLTAGAPADTAYDAALACFERKGVLDLLAICGYYSLLAMVLNTARLDIPKDSGAPLSEPAQAS